MVSPPGRVTSVGVVCRLLCGHEKSLLVLATIACSKAAAVVMGLFGLVEGGGRETGRGWVACGVLGVCRSNQILL